MHGDDSQIGSVRKMKLRANCWSRKLVVVLDNLAGRPRYFAVQSDTKIVPAWSSDSMRPSAAERRIQRTNPARVRFLEYDKVGVILKYVIDDQIVPLVAGQYVQR